MNFDQAIILILQYEGGYINDPDDPGGETKYGITKSSYPNLDIKNLTKPAAVAIYRKDFWNANNIESFPDPIRLMMFDMAVNMGMQNGGKVLQRALNRLGGEFQGTGTIGQFTLDAVKKANPILLRQWITVERMAYYNQLVIKKPVKLKFLLGWTKRAIDMLTRS